MGVWGQSPRNTTCAPLLDVRSEKLEVRNGFATFEQSRSLLEARDLEARGKKMRLQLVLFALTRAQERTRCQTVNSLASAEKIPRRHKRSAAHTLRCDGLFSLLPTLCAYLKFNFSVSAYNHNSVDYHAILQRQ